MSPLPLHISPHSPIRKHNQFMIHQYGLSIRLTLIYLGCDNVGNTYLKKKLGCDKFNSLNEDIISLNQNY